jgi:hypothetical protein
LNDHFFELELYNDAGTKKLGIWANWGTRRHLASAPFDYAANMQYTLQLDFKHAVITGSVNGNPLVQATCNSTLPNRRHRDGLVPNGQFGLKVSSNKGRVRYRRSAGERLHSISVSRHFRAALTVPTNDLMIGYHAYRRIGRSPALTAH